MQEPDSGRGLRVGMNSPAGSVTPPSERATRSRHHLTGRVVGISFAISAALHVLAIILYSMSGEIQPHGLQLPTAAAGNGVAAPQGMQVIRIAETNEPEKVRPPKRKVAPPKPTPTPTPTAQPSQATQQGAQGTGQKGTQGGERLSAAERLRPHPESKRLWAPLDPALTRLTPQERMELALSGRLQAWEDSVAAADSAAAAATDWTFTDKNGKKWGVTPGELHLGGITLPLPFNFGTTPGHRGENARRAWEWNDIKEHATQGAIRAGWKERAQAIRERRDKERKKAKADSTGSKH